MKIIIQAMGEAKEYSYPDVTTVKLDELYRRCPYCKKVKPITAFGLRNMGKGVVRLQPRCGPCRTVR